MKIYCTKWALTSGIVVYDAEIFSGGVAAVRKDVGCSALYLRREGVEWHRTPEQALARAEEMRIKKLKLLDWQMKKISSTVFKIEDG